MDSDQSSGGEEPHFTAQPPRPQPAGIDLQAYYAYQQRLRQQQAAYIPQNNRVGDEEEDGSDDEGTLPRPGPVMGGFPPYFGTPPLFGAQGQYPQGYYQQASLVGHPDVSRGYGLS